MEVCKFVIVKGSRKGEPCGKERCIIHKEKLPRQTCSYENSSKRGNKDITIKCTRKALEGNTFCSRHLTTTVDESVRSNLETLVRKINEGTKHSQASREFKEDMKLCNRSIFQLEMTRKEKDILDRIWQMRVEDDLFDEQIKEAGNYLEKLKKMDVKTKEGGCKTVPLKGAFKGKPCGRGTKETCALHSRKKAPKPVSPWKLNQIKTEQMQDEFYKEMDDYFTKNFEDPRDRIEGMFKLAKALVKKGGSSTYEDSFYERWKCKPYWRLYHKYKKQIAQTHSQV